MTPEESSIDLKGLAQLVEMEFSLNSNERKSLNLALIIGLISGALIVVSIIIYDQYRPSAYFWPLFYVIIPFFILGYKKGLLFNFPFILTVIYLAFSANKTFIDSFNDYNLTIRFTASLLGIFF